MRIMLVLVALLELAAYPAMAAAPIDRDVKEIPTGHKRSQQKPEPQEGSMAMVPAGEFMMGSPTGDSDEQPAHKVYVDAFSMDTYEVSVGQYAVFLQATGVNAPSSWETMNQPAHQKRPVANVDWADAAAYCKWTGKRLPTEAEWEKAARGTDGRLYPWGNEAPTPLHANFGKSDWNNHGVLAPIGSFEGGKSPYGIYDMAGNVWEWVSDWYDDDYYKTSPSQNPTGPSMGESKVLRGWFVGQRSAAPAIRTPVPPSVGASTQGLRVSVCENLVVLGSPTKGGWVTCSLVRAGSQSRLDRLRW